VVDDRAAAGAAGAAVTATGIASGTSKHHQVVVWPRTSLNRHTAPEGYGMEQVLLEMFEQARKLVVETDRRMAEENDRIREKEREAKLLELSAQIEAAFDFTSKEKLELDPRLDMQDGKPTVEFIVRSLRAIFVMSPQPDGIWTLNALEDGRAPQLLGEFPGGSKGDAASRRLAAARIVTAIGNWSQKGQPLAAKKPVQAETSSRWQDTAVPLEVHQERREPTYGTMGKFLGY
jgi:hypothetical protein